MPQTLNSLLSSRGDAAASGSLFRLGPPSLLVAGLALLLVGRPLVSADSDGVDVLFVAALCWSWLPLALVVLRLEHRLPLYGSRRALHLCIHFGCGIAAAFLQHLWLALVAWLLPVDYSPRVALEQSVDVFWGVGAATQLLYWIVLLAISLRSFAARAADRDAQFARARLAALQTQLRPHFLFNALNTLSALIDEDTRAAQRALGSLSQLLRASLSHEAQDETTLDREIVMTSLYLDVERARYEEQLRVTLDVPPSLRGAVVPSLVLQPIVENAIHHGMRHAAPCVVRIAARRCGHSLELSVRDEGPGFAARGTITPGIGLANVQERLHRLYGNCASLKLLSEPDDGVLVVIRLPWRIDGAGS